MKRLRQERAALGMVARENLLTEEENPYWGDDSETSLHADEIMERPEEVVLVPRTAEESAALRGWGALAVARHHAGWWCAPSRHGLAKRDVVFVGGRAGSEIGPAEEDLQVVAGTVGRVGVLVPGRCSGEAPAADLCGVRGERVGGNRVARAIVDRGRRTDRARCSVSELTQCLRWVAGERGEPETALRLLSEPHAIRRLRSKMAWPPRAGRSPSAVYEVHPGLKPHSY